jgi:uncharacterized lipoprotein
MISKVLVHSQLVPLLLDLWQGRNIIMKKDYGGRLLTSWQPRSREREKESRDKYTFRDSHQ